MNSPCQFRISRGGWGTSEDFEHGNDLYSFRGRLYYRGELFEKPRPIIRPIRLRYFRNNIRRQIPYLMIFILQ